MQRSAKIAESPLTPGVSPVAIHYRQFGRGTPIVFLHGGWGYGCYPFDRQVAEFKNQFRILIPDRSGHGRSTKGKEEYPIDFHERAAVEMLRFLDALHLERAVLWGHSDGAVIAVLMGLMAPERFAGLILEAFHFLKKKPGSREFFRTMAKDPRNAGKETCKRLAADHGPRFWKEVVRRNCSAWLAIADSCAREDEDLYEGRLGDLRVPALFVHGAADPRTEPGELDRVRRALPRATFQLIKGGRHSPHSEEASYRKCNAAVEKLLRTLEMEDEKGTALVAIS
jgi:pimeloyl-ACP methyl ester carboxylesterase